MTNKEQSGIKALIIEDMRIKLPKKQMLQLMAAAIYASPDCKNKDHAFRSAMDMYYTFEDMSFDD